MIAGPNGAGKTTFAREFLPKFADCPNFVNVDLIATGLEPFKPETAAIEAGKVMLKKIQTLASHHSTFGFETTLSGTRYLDLFKQLRSKGYKVHLIFLWLPNAEMAVQRVKDRVRQGGHAVPEIDIRRRFDRGLKNLKRYMPQSDTWLILDNSIDSSKPLAFGVEDTFNFINTEFQQEITRYWE